MLINQTYKNYAAQIADIFCEGSIPLCVTSVKQRIIKYFTDETFENSFLPNLDTGRFYYLKLTHLPSSEGFIKWNLSGKDIVNGKPYSVTIDGIPGDKRNDTNWVMNHMNSWWASQNLNLRMFFLGTVPGFYIIQINGQTPYGIVYVPGTVGGGSGGSGGSGSGDCPSGQVWFGGKCVPSGGRIKVPGGIPLPESEPIAAGFDVGTILSNPMVLIGGAALLFFYFMND